MRPILALMGVQLRLTLKSKSALTMGLLLPLVFTMVFGLSASGGAGEGGYSRPLHPVAVVNEDDTPAARWLETILGQEETLQVHRVASREAVRRLFVDQKVAAAIIIPRGYGERLDRGDKPDVGLMVHSGGSAGRLEIEAMLQRVSSRAAVDYRLARQLVPSAASSAALQAALQRVEAEHARRAIPVHTQPVRLPGKEKGGFSLGEQAMGFTVMFVMMIVFMMGGVILEERQRGTWGRILTAPVSRTQITLGYLLGFLVTGWVQFAILVGASRLLFGLQWGSGPQLAVVASAFILTSAGMGLFVAGLVRTAEQQRVVGMIAVVATSMLGGVYWPLEFVGETMRRIGYLTPQAWAMEGFRAVLLRGSSWEAIAWPVGVLLAMAAVFLAAGVARVRYE